MNERIAGLLQRMKVLEQELKLELVRHADQGDFVLRDGKVYFPPAMRARHRGLRTRLARYVIGARPLKVLTAPFIYLVAVPLALLDLCISLYQAVCFPVYGIPKVRRRDYFVFDRALLAYLNAIEKFNCAYCSYANGLIAYSREIASRTEQYWCPIKHSRPLDAAHRRYPQFLEYGDAEAYRRELAALREELKKERAANTAE